MYDSGKEADGQHKLVGDALLTHVLAPDLLFVLAALQLYNAMATLAVMVNILGTKSHFT